MQHSFITKVDSKNRSILGGNALKTRDGKDTSEALQLREVSFMSNRINYRNFKSLKHTPEERERLKKIKKQIKIENSYSK